MKTVLAAMLLALAGCSSHQTFFIPTAELAREERDYQRYLCELLHLVPVATNVVVTPEQWAAENPGLLPTREVEFVYTNVIEGGEKVWWVSQRQRCEFQTSRGVWINVPD